MIVLHRGENHPRRPGLHRWFLSDSGTVYWLEKAESGWVVYDKDGRVVLHGMTSPQVRAWAEESA